MKAISRVPYALSVCAAAMLAGCGGDSMSPSYQLPGMSQSTRAQSVSSAVAVHDASCQGQRSFQYIGHAQHFKVPKCATTVYIDAKGASGKYGGDGGEVSATIQATPSAKLIITVGGAGSRRHGGFNGGAPGAKYHMTISNGEIFYGGGGGGASDVRQGGNTLADRVVVAGGGGGGMEDFGGGTGGGLPDGGSGRTPPCDGGPISGGGGTQSAGGAGGAGSNGGLLGEGGSGYAEPAATNASSQNGVNSGNGSALICWGYSNEECGSRQRL